MSDPVLDQKKIIFKFSARWHFRKSLKKWWNLKKSILHWIDVGERNFRFLPKFVWSLFKTCKTIIKCGKHEISLCSMRFRPKNFLSNFHLKWWFWRRNRWKTHFSYKCSWSLVRFQAPHIWFLSCLQSF